MSKNDEICHSTNLLDIVRGYSKLTLSGQDYYFKHFLYLDILQFEELFKEDIKKSVKSGIQTESQLIETAIKVGGWTVEEEEKIKSLKWMIKKSRSSLSSISDINQRKHFNSQIKNDEKKLQKLSSKRTSLLSYSAESLAEVKKVDRMVDGSLFADINFKKKPEEEHKLDLTSMLFKKYADLNSQKVALNASYKTGFFDIFSTQSRDPMSIFNVNITSITIFQRNILILSNALLNKLKSTNIPEEISGDPVKMLEYEEKEQVDKKTSHGVDDLKRKMEARGGELKAEDFLS